ncbi:MAG TPA: hypothetical protein PK040_00090 [Anaerolineaceae bacterium]|nr:hypothetical protein [Anaerolineaceae bacterium]
MDRWRSLFSNLNLADGILAGLFLLVMALLGNSLAPGPGALIGILAAIVLLVIAKRKRDKLQK